MGLFGKTLEEARQVLIERYPEVLPGAQIDPDDPPRFALLGREVAIGSLAVDHVLVDQEGVLTRVETKLVENPESRREVIGQVLQYAANAEANWRDGRLQERAAAYWARQGQDLNDVLAQRLGNVGLDIEEFWRTVHENLRQGRLRLVIVGDELRPEIRRIIEYLNQEMENAEVHGLELQCYGDQAGLLVLVPRLVGQTQAVADRKRTDASTQWGRPTGSVRPTASCPIPGVYVHGGWHAVLVREREALPWRARRAGPSVRRSHGAPPRRPGRWT